MQNAKLVSENTTSLEIQDKARDQEVATLTNVLLSISDNKLESVGLLNEIRDRILELIRRNVSSVCTGTWSILKMCNTLRKRNVDPKCGRRRRMEPSESKSAAAVSNGEVPQQQQQQQLRSSEPSPLAKEGALGGELRNKLDFKGADEGESSEGCAEDCMMYLKTGSCRFGSSCMFNHSIRSRIVYVRQLPLIKKYV
uniref:C3H1-type domain-containing protein n=2 Tax=Lotus japonicus TaxID=34305 RepID=I3SW75_LOTJA|nr:unknown [Lotus japonicus]